MQFRMNEFICVQRNKKKRKTTANICIMDIVFSKENKGEKN